MDLLLGMRIFVRVVERGSFSAAARDLGMSQPVVSERTRRLEDHLGTRLLARRPQRLELTEVGRIFYQRSKRTLEFAAFAEESARASGAASLPGTLRIAAPSCIGDAVLPMMLHRFQRSNPELTCDLIVDDGILDPVNEGVDIAVRLGEAPSINCEDIDIGLMSRVLVATNGYIAAHGAPRTPGELRKHPFLRVSGSFQENTIVLQHAGKAVEARINPVWTVGNWRPLHSLMLEGEGIGIFPAPMVQEALSSGRARRILPEYEISALRVRLLSPRRNPMPEKVTRATAFLKDELRVLCV